MRLRTAMIAGFVMLFLLGNDVFAQNRGRPGRLSTFRDSRYRGRTSRVQRLLHQSPLDRENQSSLLDRPSPSRIRTRYLLNARNMLSVRSSLGRNVTPLVGRSTLFDRDLDDLIAIRPFVSPSTTQPSKGTLDDSSSPSSYEDALENRLARMARERFALGAAYARQGDYLRAEQAFEAAKQLDYDNPQPYVASMFVAFKQRNTNTAIVQMILALDRADSLEDLRIKDFVDLLYEGETPQERREAFRSTKEALTMTTAVGDASPLNVLLAYFAWVDDDLDTAVRAAETATKAFGAKYEEDLGKFHDLLAAERTARQSPVVTEERENPTQGEGGSPVGS